MMIDNLKFQDVMITHILPLLDNDDLIVLYNTSETLRAFVLSFRNWERAYKRDFPHDNTAHCSFEHYIKRYNAAVNGLPNIVVRDLVASRFLMGALSLDGQVFIGPNWSPVPNFRAENIWASQNHLYALNGHQLWMWKFLDQLPTRIDHPLELGSATIIRSGASHHAVYIPGTGVCWWGHTIDNSFEHSTVLEYDKVNDVLVLKNGLVVLTANGIDYWHKMTIKKTFQVPQNVFKYLEIIDFHQETFAAVTHCGERLTIDLSRKSLGAVTIFALVSAILGAAKLAVARKNQRQQQTQHYSHPSKLTIQTSAVRQVKTMDSFAELVIGEFKCKT